MVSLTAKEPSRQTRRPSQDRVGDGERNIGQREGDEAGRGRKEEEARECTSCGGMGAGVRGAQNLWAHRRIGGVTLAALARINKHRWVVVGGLAAVAARRASENDARDATLASGTGESGAPLDARCTRASQRRPRRGRGTRPTLVSGRVSGDSFDRGPYPERERERERDRGEDSRNVGRETSRGDELGPRTRPFHDEPPLTWFSKHEPGRGEPAQANMRYPAACARDHLDVR